MAASWADLPYTVRMTNAPWLHFRVNQGVTPYEGSPFSADAVTVDVQPDRLPPGVYHATLSFSVDSGVNIPQVPVTFRILP